MCENEGAQDTQFVDEQATQAEISDDTTEALLLQKLMSEDETEKLPAIKPLSEPEPISPPLATREELEPVGTATSHPPLSILIPEGGRDVAVPTEDIPEERQQKSPKHGLVSRILARVWHT